MSESRMESRIENDRVLVLERVFDAPVRDVFRMFSEAANLLRWWGPRGWQLTHNDLDFTPGGTWHYCMTGVDDSLGEYMGMESWGKAIFESINAPYAFVYTDYFSDAEGNTNDSMPATRVSMEFVEQQGRTRVISRSEYADAGSLNQVMEMGMLQGITETWDRLEEELARPGAG